MTKTITGGCLCGNIRYSVSQPIEKIIACHCTHCQKASGSDAAYNARRRCGPRLPRISRGGANPATGGTRCLRGSGSAGRRRSGK